MATTDETLRAASQPPSAGLTLSRLTVGVDNLRYDVYLSPEWAARARQFLFEQILHLSQHHLRSLFPSESRRRSAAASEFKHSLTRLLREALNLAKQQDNIEIKLLARLALIKWLTAELQAQFSQLAIQCKERVEKTSGVLGPSSVQAFVIQSKVSDFQSDKRHLLNAVGETLFQLFEELEEQTLRPARQALFGSSFDDACGVLRNLLIFLDNPNDSALNLEHYVMLGHFRGDPDDEDQVCEIVSDLLREHGLAAAPHKERVALEKEWQETGARLQETSRRLRELEGQQDPAAAASGAARALRWLGGLSGRRQAGLPPAHLPAVIRRLEGERKKLTATTEELGRKVAFLRQQEEDQLTSALTNPENAERLFGSLSAGASGARPAAQHDLLRQLHARLDQGGMLRSILACYHLKSVYRDFCPPLNPHQLKQALATRRGWREFEEVLDRYPTRDFPVEKLEDLNRRIRQFSREDTVALLARFVRDLMRLRRDKRHREQLLALLEKINIVADEKIRRISRINRTLYEFLLPDEAEAKEEEVITHVVIKADVRDSTGITDRLLARGLNPATHLSYNFYEPVSKLVARYAAAKIFIEGDALILGFFETENNRASQRPVAKACLLAKEVIEVCQVYNQRARENDLPVLELGLGIAYQAGPPHYWEDDESRIMISAALNHSDRLASCARIARRLVGANESRFRVFQFLRDQGPRPAEDEEELMIRYNVMGVALNEAGFRKLQEEIALSPIRMGAEVMGQRESITLWGGTVPLGSSFEKLIIREAHVPRLLFPGAVLQEWTERVYFEVCVDPRIYEEPPPPV